MRLSGFIAELRDELGDTLVDFVGEPAFERWINVGQSKLGSYLQSSVPITWASGDGDVTLPSDFHHLEEVDTADSYTFPSGRLWGTKFLFNCPATFSGSGTLRYYARRPAITNSVDSTFADDGNEALISYALYRFFKRMSSSRADYRKYATITQSNGVDIAELESLSEHHLQDFETAKETIEPLRASLYYED